MRTSSAADEARGRLSALALIVSGTFSTVFSKMQYNIRSHGTELCVDPSDPTQTTTLCPFDKPWFTSLLAKIAMALCLVYLYARKVAQHRAYLETPLLRTQKGGKRYLNTPEASAIRQKRVTARESTGLLATEVGGGAGDDHVPLKTMLAVAWPSFLDLAQTMLSSVGLLWVSSSVFQMARGSVIIFSAFLSVKYMNKRLYAYHVASIAIVGLSVVLVGWAGTSDDAGGAAGSASHNALLGLALIIVSQLLTAVQIVVEEHMMVELNVSPMLLVGLEGLWGLAFYVLLIPLLTLTPPSTTPLGKIWHEDFYDSIVKIANSPPQLVLSVLSILVIAVLNVTANYVTKHLSAVLRSITETLRTLGVWLVGLLVYYVFQWRGKESPGEAWTNSSWIELLGFVLMVYGTLAYKKVLQLPIPSLYAAETRDRTAASYRSPFMTGAHK
ncbi:hypothetical protein ATCC90586_001932 [Pythium insidiosum]|nr:hypothetical protein ATCC90586_001932 [Pythium insidiosum]